MSIPNVGGYRLIRKLGEGVRAEVYLGHPLRDESSVNSVALKIFRPEVTAGSVLGEAEALARAQGEHVVEIIDVASDAADARALVLARLPGCSLSRLLADRAALTPGEAITLLAPIAATVARVHTAGVTLGSLAPKSVLFDRAGAPVLAGLGSASLIAPGLPPAPRASEPGIAADLRDFAALASAVLLRVPGAETAMELVADASVDEGEAWLDDVTTELFSLGAAEPIRFGAAVERPPARIPMGSAPVGSRGQVDTGERDSLPRRANVLASWLEEVLPAGGVLARIGASVGAVRVRIWVTAGAVAAALVAAILVVPPGGSDAAAPPAVTASAVPVTADPAASAVPDDPVAVIPVLLAERDRCLSERSVLCLDGVTQPGSAASAADVQLVRELQAGGEAPARWSVGAIGLTEQLGDSALVTVVDPGDSEPASFLLVKGEAGWRIRDYLWE